ncbi:MAG TPA: SigE family RNA polymerase sigma factor [Streptosporangiaceae bacterium]
MGRQAEVEEFSAFVAGSQARIVRIGELLTGDRGRGEDLAQHGFTQAYAAWRRIRDGDPEAYVRRCMVNAHTDWWRRRYWREQPTDVLPERTDGTDVIAAAADREVVLRALSRLTMRERIVLVLRYYLDLSEQQIATELKIAPGTVKSAAARALAKLRADAELREETIR